MQSPDVEPFGPSPDPSSWAVRTRLRTRSPVNGTLREYALVLLMLAVLTFLLWHVGWSFDRVNMAMLYLLPVLVSAVRFGRGPAYLAAGLGVLLFDFFFVPPLLSFSVSDFRYLISFAVFLVVAGLTAAQATRLRAQLHEAQDREARAASLYAISRQIVAVTDLNAIFAVIVHHLSTTIHSPAAIFLADGEGRLSIAQKSAGRWNQAPDMRLSELVYRTGKTAPPGTDLSMPTQALCLPLKIDSDIYGVLCIHEVDMATADKPDRLAFLEAVAGLASVSIARVRLEEQAKLAEVTAASERLRTSLLDSISHELRTPLATIIGSATGIIEGQALLTADDQGALLATIREGAMRMNRLVTNLLGMVRLESGMLGLKRRWCDVADIVGVCLTQLDEVLRSRRVTVHIPDELPVLCVDDVLIEQVLVNVISNAVKYSPDGSPIVIDARVANGWLEVRVRDEGIGIGDGEKESVFGKFYRSPRTLHIPGTGLGLAICRGIALAHGGDIRVAASEGSATCGSTIILTLPIWAVPDDQDRLDWEVG